MEKDKAMNIRTKQFQLLTDIELVCTVPAHQHKGLAAAALSRHDAVLRPLGAELMTGGGNEFYKKIGYTDQHVLLHIHK